MTKFNVSTPSGFPEFTPAQSRVYEHWKDTIRSVYEKYGFPRYLREPMIHTRYLNTLHQGYSRMNKPTLTI